MNILVVSDREYKKTSRGIDIITTYLAGKGHSIDHLVFFRRKRFPEVQVAENIRQLYFYDSIKLHRGKLQFLIPGFILLAYFRHLIRNQTSINFKKYDYVVLESGYPIYLAGEINSKIIYRQSDSTHISFNSNRNFYQELELEVIKKALFVTSALDSKYFPLDFKDKIFHWHSGFIPAKRNPVANRKKYFVIMGGKLDWRLIKKIGIWFPKYAFKVIGIPGRKKVRKNIEFEGYLGYDSYQELLSGASGMIIPLSTRYVYKLRQVSFTAKIFVSMQMGMPVLLRAYGSVQNSDPEKKLFVYRNIKEALMLFNDITDKINSGIINYEVSEETQDFLTPQTTVNRLKELETIFSHFNL